MFDHEFTQSDEHWALALEFSRAVAAKNWIALSWPVQFHGGGRSRLEHMVMMEEFFYREAPLVNFIGWALAAGTLLLAGTDAQRERFLPPIARSEVLWAEGLTEPDAGSDLASLSTRAVRSGDDWILNGRKTYMTWGHLCDVAYVAARTSDHERKQAGISIFCVDLRSPGITLTPLINIAGGRQNLVYFDDVVVSGDNLLGAEGAGWSYIMNAFYASGGTNAAHARFERLYDEMLSYCLSSRQPGRGLLIDDPSVRDRLAELALISRTQRLLAYEATREQDARRSPPWPGLLAVSHKEALPRFAQICTEILGPSSQLTEDDPAAPLHGLIEAAYRRSFANHAGGTPQVKRMVLATRGLGLPR
jgi:3-oxocholest-4-en-26-oyl-CoA dehydrogenase alpha subunit